MAAVSDHLSTRRGFLTRRAASRAGVLGAVIVLLSVPLAIVAQLLAGVPSEISVHLLLTAGMALLAISASRPDLPRWMAWAGALTAAGLGLVFLLQGLTELTHSETLSALAYGVLGQWPEKVLGDLLLVWFIGVNLLVGRGKTRRLGWVVLTLAACLEVARMLPGLGIGSSVPGVVPFLVPFVWFVFESAAARIEAPTAASLPRERRAPRLLRLGLRILTGAIAACVALLLVGAAYEALASTQDAVRYPPPGRLVDVDGRAFHINCVGQGSPTILLDAGAGEVGSLAWGPVPADLASLSRVCTYDRAGLGWSSPGRLPRTAGQVVSDLHALLSQAGESGPFVTVGHSLGGKHMRLYAARYPSEVAGMVLVDARHEDIEHLVPAEVLRQENQQTREFRELEIGLRRVGITRTIGPWLVERAGPELRGLPLVYFLKQGEPAAAEANISEISSVAESNAQLEAEAGPLGDKPLTVLMRGKPISDPTYWSAWQATQRTMAGLSSQGRLIVAEQSGHTIHLEQPDLVVASIRQTLEQARTTASQAARS
jgi:pimeloyl-ACP methyl ester carboxylesterase